MAAEYLLGNLDIPGLHNAGPAASAPPSKWAPEKTIAAGASCLRQALRCPPPQRRPDSPVPYTSS